jgi:DNA-binding beta-propeller fold protein YncE
MRSFALPLALALALLVGCEPAVEPEPEPTPIPLGPGLGNLEYTPDELNQPVAWIDNDNGVPEPDTIELGIKPFGTNVGVMHGGYLFTLFAPDSGWTPGGLLWFDVSDPRNIELVARHYDRQGTTSEFREAHSYGFSDFDGRRHAVFHSGYGVEFWDLADPHDPIQLSKLALPGVNAGDYNFVSWQLVWQGPYVYVASSEQGVFVVDARDPLNPRLADRGGRPNPVPLEELGGFRIGPIFAVGNLMVVSSMDDEGGYATLDISDPANPELLGTAREGFAKFYATCFGGNRIVGSVRGGGAKMTMHDVTDPFRITPVHVGPEIDEQLYCGMQDHFVFQGNEGDWAKVDVSDPTDPQIVGRGELDRPNTDHGQVIPFGNLLWVGNDHGTGSALAVHQLEPDTTPPAVTMVSPPDGAVSQAVTSRVGVTFSDNVLIESVGADTWRLQGPDGDVPGRWAIFGNTVNFAPDEPLATASTYTLRIEGVQDWVGNPSGVFESTFETAAIAGDGGSPLEVTITTTEPLLVGEERAFTVELEGAEQAEITWSFDEGEWTAPSTDLTAAHAWAEVGHRTILVRATDGARVSTDTATITVHRPAAPTKRSSGLAWDAGRGLVWVANRDQGTVSAVDAEGLSLAHEIPVCDEPRSVSADGAVWVACAEELVRLSPNGVDLTIDLGPGAEAGGVIADERIWVSLEGTGELASFDADGGELSRTPLERPRGLGLADGTVYVSRFVSGDERGTVYAVDADEPSSVTELTLRLDDTTIDAEDRGRGLPNYLAAPAVSPDGSALWVASKQDNAVRGLVRDGQPLDHESSVRAVLSQLSLDGVEGPRHDFNDRALPTDAHPSPLGDYVYVVLMGSNAVEVVDAYTGENRGALPLPGLGPRSVVSNDDGTRVFVHAWLSRSVMVYDTSDLLANRSFAPTRLAEVDVVTEDALAPDLLAGKRIFVNARDARMSLDGYISCATCHFDGAEDGRVWDFTDRGEGLRNTIDLRGRAGTAHGPLHWTANFDEIQDFEHDIRGAFGGGGFLSEADWAETNDTLGEPKAGRSVPLDQLAAYVASLGTFPPSPWPEDPDGAQLFDDLACGDCHGGAAMTDSGDARHDVGTITDDSGQRLGAVLDGFDTPTLRGLHATPPYLHDGSAATVRDVLVTRNPDGLHGEVGLLDDNAIDALEAYLLSLD